MQHERTAQQCECGCGQATAGRFVHGHNRRLAALHGHPGAACRPVSGVLLARVTADWAYLAGLMDGEGHFNAATGTNSFGLVIKMAEPEVIAHLLGKFGGHARREVRGESRRDVYVWTLGAMRDVQFACRRLMLYMVLKRDECSAMCDLATHVADGRPRWPFPTSRSAPSERLRRREELLEWKRRSLELRSRVRQVRDTRKAASLNVPLQVAS